jgi:hypothetical protein
MTTISAMVLADSVSANAPRLTSVVARYPLVIHAELMTHRVFSRNAASSRAIPFKRMLQAVIDDPYVPLVWTRNEPGMQGHTELEGRELLDAKNFYEDALQSAIFHARKVAGTNAHKQIVNRLLGPFAHITTLITSTDWANWEALRLHVAAEPHIQLLARKIKVAMDGSQPRNLLPGEWHLPYVGTEDKRHISEQLVVSVARCASVSYRTVDDKEIDTPTASRIYEKLLKSQPIHASPAEHQARVCVPTDPLGLNGNLGAGWIQYRKTLVGERA